MDRQRDNDGSSNHACRRCGSGVPTDAQFCPSCGSPPDAPETPMICGYCGHTVEPGQQFCVSCGTSLSEEPVSQSNRPGGRSATAPKRPPGGQTTPVDAGSDVDDRKLKAFRRRLDPYLENGWEIDRDEADTVDLSYRDFGSPGIHAALVLYVLTIGWGNLIYAIYSVAVRRNSATVHRDDSPQRWPELDPRPVGGALRWTLGFAMVLVTLVAVQTAIGDPTNPISWTWVAASLIATGTLLPPVNRRLRNRGAVSEFGWQTATEERMVYDDLQCTVCSSFVDHAVERSFEKYFAVAGARVTTAESGENYYCEECCKTALSTSVDRELSELLDDDDATTAGPDREYSPELERR